jgi:hypothetical protein
MATKTADSADSILLATSAATDVLLSTVTPGLADPTGLTGLMSKQLSDSVIIHILCLLSLPAVLALRATSRLFAEIASRLFRQLFPARRICLNERLLRPSRWEIGGPEHLTLDGLRKLYADGGPVEVYIVARAPKAGSKGSTDSSQVEGFPTYRQTRVLTDRARGFLSPDDQVRIYLEPRGYTNDHVNFARLAQFGPYITDFSVQSGAPLWIWQIEFLRKTTLTKNLTRLDLGGVLVPVPDDSDGSGSGGSGKAKKDATKEIRLMLSGLPGLKELSLAGTRLEIGNLLKHSLLRMTSMVSLDLGGTRTGPEAAADVVSCMPNLRSLDLSGIRSVPERLAGAVFSLPLRILGLSQCGITDVRGLTSAALRAPQSTIERVDLSWNALDSAGDIAALVDALPALRGINLQETLRNLDQLVDVFVSRPVKAYLSFPLAGRLANHDTRNAMQFPDNIVFFPLNHGP